MKTIRKLAFISLSVSILFCRCNQQVKQDAGKSLASDVPAAGTDEDDAKFVADAAEAHYTDLYLAKLAQEKASSQEIKQMAAGVQVQHDSLLSQLKEYAERKHFTVPSTPDDAKQVTKLAEKEPVKFDKDWCSKMVDRYEETISNYERKAARETTDTELTNWINKTLPAMRSYLDKLKACEKSLR